MTCGPWRPINLEVFSSRISDLYFTTKVEKSLKSAEFVAKADVEGAASEVKFDITLDGKEVASKTVKVTKGHATHKFEFEDPALWYPAPYGKQPLYTVTATLLEGKSELSSQSKKSRVNSKAVDRPARNLILFRNQQFAYFLWRQ
jgi:beta-mannosidase